MLIQTTHQYGLVRTRRVHAIVRSARAHLVRSIGGQSGLSSVVEYAEAVLRTAAPSEKIRLTFEARQRLADKQIHISNGISGWPTQLPEFPAREKDNPTLYEPKKLPNVKHVSLPVAMLHSLAHIELGAIDNYMDTIARFDPSSHGRQLPEAFYRDLLKVANDEARHFQMIDQRLRELGSRYGELPAHLALLKHAYKTSDCLAARLAVVPLVQEARALDSGDRLVNKLQSVGDKRSATIVKQIVAEEKSHVAYGVKWFTFLCQQLGKEPVEYFQQLALQFFPEGLPGPFDVRARLAANMPPTWYTCLEIQRVKKRSKSPTNHLSTDDFSRATTQNSNENASPSSAACVLREKHQPKVLVLGCVWPERKSSAAGVRTADLIDMFTNQGYQVLCVSPSRPNDHTEAFQRQNESVSFHQIDANQSDQFQRFLMQHPTIEMILFDRFIADEMYGWQVNRWAPQSALRVLDLQDLHFLRKAREVQFKQALPGSPPSLELDLDLLESSTSLNKFVIRELASIHRSDLTLFVSPEEQKLLTQAFQLDAAKLVLCDFFYPPVNKSTINSFASRNHVAFIGSFKHSPNVDAVHWLKQEIVPAFRNLHNQASNQVEFHVYGSYMTPKSLRLDDPAMGFRVLGAAEDVHETLAKYRVSVAPLRFGAGIKGKIADSWFNGTPVVTTCVGAEGMVWSGASSGLKAAQDWNGGLVANDATHFAEAVNHLYHDQQLWQHKQQSAIDAVMERYDAATNQQHLMSALVHAREELQLLRQRNWMGKILWSEKFRATEYMSRYIQAKNANLTNSNSEK